MTISTQDLKESIAVSLAAVASKVKQAGSCRWLLSIGRSPTVKAEARLDDGWLHFSSPIGNKIPALDAWKLLELNAHLDGLCKFASTPYRDSTFLLADIPCDQEIGVTNLTARLGEVCAGLQAAPLALQEALGAESRGALPSPDHAKEKRESSSGITALATLLEQTGWPFSNRPGGSLNADLEIRNGFSQAVIEDQGSSGVVVYAEIGRWDALSEHRRDALGVFLLSACSIVRMARAAVFDEGKQTTARFETRMSSPAAAELAHALAALSVACGQFGGEVLALTHEGIAKAYLSAAVCAQIATIH